MRRSRRRSTADHARAGTKPQARGVKSERRRVATSTGRREPAYRLVPVADDDSKAREAIQLARDAGLTLDEFQCDILEAGMGLSGGRWAADEVVVVLSRQNGKSLVLVIRGLWGAAVAGETVLYSAHQYKAAAECFLLAKQICETEAFQQFKPKVRAAHGAEGITFASGGRLLFIARSRVSGRGFSPDVVIADEAFELNDLALSALKPSLAAAKQPQIWFASSAPHETSTVLRRLCLKGRAGTAERMTYLEWSADAELAVGDVEGWKQANPALGGRIALGSVASELDSMTEEDFARERLSRWDPTATAGVFDLDQWAVAAVLAKETDAVVGRSIGLDVNPARTRACIAAAASLADDRILVEVLREDKGVDWIVAELVGLYREDSSVTIVIDQASQARTLIPDLKEAALTVVTTDVKGMTDASALFYDHVVESRLRHLDQPVLNAAIASAAQRKVGDAWAWARRAPGANVSPLVACSLALWGVKNPTSGDFFVFLNPIGHGR